MVEDSRVRPGTRERTLHAPWAGRHKAGAGLRPHTALVMSEVIKGIQMRLKPIQKVGMEIPALAPIVVPGSNQGPKPLVRSHGPSDQADSVAQRH